MLRLVIVCLLGIGLNFNVRALPPELLNKSYLEVKTSLDTLYGFLVGLERPASHLNTIEIWALQAQDAGDERLAYQLRMLKLSCEDPYKAPLEPWLLEIKQIIDYARVNNYQYFLVDALVTLGYYREKKGKYGASLEAYHEAYTIYKNFSLDLFPLIRVYLYNLSLGYYRLQDYTSTIKYSRELLLLKPVNSYVSLKAVYNTIGLSYRHLQQYDSAEVYFKKIIEIAREEKSEIWEGIAAGNLGMTYYYLKKYDEAIPLIEKDISESTREENHISVAKALWIRAEIHYLRGEVAEAQKKLLKSRSLLRKEAVYGGPANLESQHGVYELLSKISAHLKQYKQAYIYSDSAHIFKDSSTVFFNTTKLASAQQTIDILEEELVEKAFLHEKEIYGLIRNGLIIGVLVLMIIGGLLVSRQRLKQKSLQTELTIASSRLRDFTQSIHEKNEIIEQVSRTKSIIPVVDNNDEDEDTETILELRKAILLTDEQWDEFKALFEKVHKGFFYKLNNAFPNLTPAETRFLTLVKLKLSPKEMAGMLGISDNAIRLYRHRLRKKLELKDDQTVEGLVDFITY